MRYWLFGNRSGIRFAGAAKQDDAEQKRNNEWDCRDPDNEAGIGVPWRGECVRIGKVQTPDYKQQQRDQTNDHECARSAATDPPGLYRSRTESPGRKGHCPELDYSDHLIKRRHAQWADGTDDDCHNENGKEKPITETPGGHTRK